MKFYKVDPSLENYWRSIILFGRNVASYKFSLAKSLYELNKAPNDFVTLEELAEPFSKHLCEHLKHAPKQITSNSSKFIDSCLAFNNKDIDKDRLIATTVKLGFNNVIDAFHNVNNNEIEKRFFVDERRASIGIRLTDNFYKLGESIQSNSLEQEVESRWRLVEHGWSLGVSKSLISVEYDSEHQSLFSTGSGRRVDVTSCRGALNGYQKGRCFYCYQTISIESKSPILADVDHFLPWALNDSIQNVNGVWNLVLSCSCCNRGAGGKFAKVPTINLLQRLHKRNEYLITSHLPLRNTLIQQTGGSEQERIKFLQKEYSTAKKSLIHEWTPEVRGIITL